MNILEKSIFQLILFTMSWGFIDFGDIRVTSLDMLAPIMIALSLLRPITVTIYLLIVIFLTFIIISSTLFSEISTDFDPLIKSIRILFVFIPSLYIFTHQKLDNDTIISGLNYLRLGLIFNCIMGLIMFYSGIEIDGAQKLWLDDNTGYEIRATSRIGNSGPFGVSLFILFFIQYFDLAVLRKYKHNFFDIFVFSIVAMGIFYSGSRVSIIMILSSLSVIAWFNSSFVFKIIFPLMSIALFIFGLSFDIDLSVYNSQLRTTLLRIDVLGLFKGSNFFESVRFQSWADLVNFSSDIPLLGYGYKSFESYIGFFVDNTFLLILFEVGYLGLLSLVFLLIWLISQSFLIRSYLRAFALALCVAFFIRMNTGGILGDWSTTPAILVLFIYLFRFRTSIGLRHYA